MRKMILAVVISITLAVVIIQLVDIVMHYVTSTSYSQDYQNYKDGGLKRGRG